MAVLWFDGVAMPDPALNGIAITKEKIWSKNAGRSSESGKMMGDIVAIKYKIQIKWPILSQEQSALVDKFLSNDDEPFFKVKFKDPKSKTGEFVTKDVYAGTPTYPVYSYVDNLPRYVGVGVDLVEQ